MAASSRFGLPKWIRWNPRLHELSTFHDAYVASISDTGLPPAARPICTGGGGGNAGPGVTPPLTMLGEFSPLALLALP